MKTVWKYSIQHGTFSHAMPKDANVLFVKIQDAEPMMWAIVDPEKAQTTRNFRCIEDRCISGSRRR